MELLASVAPLPGHAVFLLLVQLAALLIIARLGALLVRAVGLPSVVGELAAGIVLGPSVFGYYFPEAFHAVFPQEAAQFHLLETVGVLGMVLLLLLTGLETDLKLLKNLGRAALVASALGMIVPFASGFGLGLWMPEEYVAQPEQRVLFASFLATAMAISAMPVIAKILMDLDLTRRNIGLVILSAGVVDDTAGWLVLSVIAGAAAQGGSVQFAGLGVTLLEMLGFLLVMTFAVFPVLRVVFRRLARSNAQDTELVVVVAFTFLCAAVTEHIGVHAVFGAFIAGTLLRQVPHLRQETVHRLEAFVFTILAPVFFGTVGLKVDLWTLAGGGEVMLLIVLGIAVFGKLVGCSIGGLWGGLSFWESMSIAVAMNARGAMELVVASIGLSLGILNEQMFSIIVVVAIATSFMAPVLLRMTMRLVRVTRDEELRMLEEQSRGVFNPQRMRILVATSGSRNALAAAKVAYGLAAQGQEPVEIFYADEQGSAIERLFRVFGASEARKNIEEHLATLKDLAGAVPTRVRNVTGQPAARAILEEAARGFDLVVTGASVRSVSLGGAKLEEIVAEAPCHVAVVKAGRSTDDLRRVFVPVDGSTVSRIAAEFAQHYAESANAELTLGILSEQSGGELLDPTEELVRISPVFRIAKVLPRIERLHYDPTRRVVADAIRRGGYDLVVVGAENRAVRRRLFFGHENEQVIQLDTVTTVILVPQLTPPR
jgi:Kef-type K+ transport system membrane component KefB/nucleotide-binding universal stress UspA family protein